MLNLLSYTRELLVFGACFLLIAIIIPLNEFSPKLHWILEFNEPIEFSLQIAQHPGQIERKPRI